MWLSRKKYDDIIKRLNELERPVTLRREVPDTRYRWDGSEYQVNDKRLPIKTVVELVVKHCGLVYRHLPESEAIVKKPRPKK